MIARAFLLLVLFLWATPAAAVEPGAQHTSWHERYNGARTDLVEGRYRRAESALLALALEANGPYDRQLALEMARLAAAYAERVDAAPTVTPKSDIRSADELTLLYGSAFIYGVGTGAWFLLEAQPDSALTATIPFAVLTAAPAIAIATVDGYSKLRRGLPHAISAGLYLGLAEGVWLAGYQTTRGNRVREKNPTSDLAWSPETVAGVLWVGATAGATLGGLLGSSVPTTPGRVSFVASTTLWSGAIGGLAAGALFPNNGYRQEHAFATGGLLLNAGLAAGFALAGMVSPSVARVRLVDLMGLAGAVAATGLYLSLANNVDVRLAEGIAAAGAGIGLATGWFLTRNMPKSELATATVNPVVAPIRGGFTGGVGGVF